MSPFEQALVELGSRGRASIAEAHDVAVAIGGSYLGTSADDECICTTQDLLCVAGDAAVDLAMLAQIFEAAPGAAEHARILRSAAAGVARMNSRSLAVHARDNGYDSGVWFERAREETEFLIADDHDELFDGLRTGGESITLARRVASEIFASLACAPADRMGVPGHVANSLGASVAVFMIADVAI